MAYLKVGGNNQWCGFPMTLCMCAIRGWYAYALAISHNVHEQDLCGSVYKYTKIGQKCTTKDVYNILKFNSQVAGPKFQFWRRPRIDQRNHNNIFKTLKVTGIMRVVHAFGVPMFL